MTQPQSPVVAARFSAVDRKRYYRALLERDSEFEGIFVVGVKTTGIFCRPTCSARKPKAENVEFFPASRIALLRGYRPCKICSPMLPAGAAPDWLRPLLREIDEEPGLRLKDWDLRQRGLDPNRLRRWFKRHHGMTFQAYLRSLRIGQAFGRIRHGEKVIEAAFDSGYESLSGFTESFKKTVGFAPKSSRYRQIVTVTRLLTPLGPMLAGASSEGLCLLEFADRRMLETQLKRISRWLEAELVPGTHPVFELAQRQLDEYFAGTRREFDVPMEVPGTPFQEKVWKELMTIPYGETSTYSNQARRIGQPTAVRAVARANGDNRIAILIPCHRVIGKNGELIGYGGGLEKKGYLLRLESEHSNRVSVNGRITQWPQGTVF